jgi:hypothetical protein
MHLHFAFSSDGVQLLGGFLEPVVPSLAATIDRAAAGRFFFRVWSSFGGYSVVKVSCARLISALMAL